MTFFRPTWATVSRGSFSKNIRALRRWVGSDVQLLAVLKADAYGHGAKDLARAALHAGASSLGVSSLEEGLSLRQEGITAPILILGGIYPLSNFKIALESELTPTVASFAAARSLNALAKKRKKPAPFHLKVDTGMGRIGVSPEEAVHVLSWLSRQPYLSLEGVYTHLSCADSRSSFTHKQLARFEKVKRAASREKFEGVLFHTANSAGVLAFREAHHDLVRPGLALYGVSPLSGRSPVKLFPVLSWRTKVIFLKKVGRGFPVSYGRTFTTKKPSLIATLPVGYADGVPRLASNRGWVLIRGKKCPIIGRITMDHFMVDATGTGARVGDEAVLLGSQKGKILSAHDWASWAETCSYEILTGISNRVPRVVIS